MAKGSKNKRARRRRRPVTQVVGPTKWVATFTAGTTGNMVDNPDIKGSAKANDTVVFKNDLKYDVVVLLFGPPIVLTDPKDPSQPAGVEVLDNVRAIFVAANKSSDVFGTTNHGQAAEVTKYMVLVDPRDTGGNIGGPNKINAGQEPDIIIGG